MATTVHEEKSITLMDGTTFEVRPLKISLLRPFMKKFEAVAAVADDNDKSMTILVECVQIAMKQYKPDLSDDISTLEDILDLPTVYKIVEAASGMNLSELAQVLSDAE
jgi:hypothetical protein